MERGNRRRRKPDPWAQTNKREVKEGYVPLGGNAKTIFGGAGGFPSLGKSDLLLFGLSRGGWHQQQNAFGVSRGIGKKDEAGRGKPVAAFWGRCRLFFKGGRR